jgi:hypothetical protein
MLKQVVVCGPAPARAVKLAAAFPHTQICAAAAAVDVSGFLKELEKLERSQARRATILTWRLRI